MHRPHRIYDFRTTLRRLTARQETSSAPSCVAGLIPCGDFPRRRDAAKSVSDYLNDGENIICISVMNRLSIDSDGSESFLKRLKNRNGVHAPENAEAIGLGERHDRLIDIDLEQDSILRTMLPRRNVFSLEDLLLFDKIES